MKRITAGRTLSLSIAGVCGMLLAGATMAGLGQPAGPGGREDVPDLNRSLGLECVVMLRGPVETDRFMNADGLATVGPVGVPVRVTGTLTGVAADAIVVRNKRMVRWIPRDHIALVQFEDRRP